MTVREFHEWAVMYDIWKAEGERDDDAQRVGATSGALRGM